MVLVKAARDDNKLTSLALTKLDVLSGLSEIKVCIAYKKANRFVEYQSGDADYLTDCQPVYESLPGWSEDISAVRVFQKLPKHAQKFVRFIEKEVEIPVNFISVGPKRGEVKLTGISTSF